MRCSHPSDKLSIDYPILETYFWRRLKREEIKMQLLSKIGIFRETLISDQA
jgi:hypothetical protein